MEIIDFTGEHLDEAQALALENYQEEQACVPVLPGVDSLPGMAEFLENGLGVAAVDQNRLAGFLCCHNPRENAFRSRAKGVFSPVHGHGAAVQNRGLIYKRMYQTAAEKWVKADIAYHGLALYAHDHEAVSSLFTSGFGLRCVDAIRPLEIIGMPRSEGIHFAELVSSQQSEIRELRKMLMEHLGKSPCFMYFNQDEIQQNLDQLEKKESRLFVARAGQKSIAYAEVSPVGENFATTVGDMANITGAYCLDEYRGRHIYPHLLDLVISTLKEEGYGRLGVDFESFNPVAYGFWLKYFTPYTYSVVRRIDECAITGNG